MEVSDASFRLAIALEMLSNVNKMFLVSFYCPASAPTSLHPTSLPLLQVWASAVVALLALGCIASAQEYEMVRCCRLGHHSVALIPGRHVLCTS